MDGFCQTPPRLGNQYLEDRVLRSWLRRHLPAGALRHAEPDFEAMGELSAGHLYQRQLAERELEPSLRQWDAWGNRVDEITLTPLWQEAQRLAATHGLVAAGYEGTHQPWGRVVQFALVYLFHPSTDVYTCPLAMTDGAARALLDSGNAELVSRAVGRLTSRDPGNFWTSGQWMTETTGGSDVGSSETVARQDENGRWRLFGRKWFTSAATSEMALTLARPEGNPLGGRGLALFYLETRDGAGGLNGIEVLRLKDKLGTRKLPTAELRLDGTVAVPVRGLEDGVKGITPMLNITRTWNAVCAVSTMRRALALARAYANQRVVFNRPLAEQPLHLHTLAGLQAIFEASFQLTFEVIRLLGLVENDRASDEDRALLRLLTPLAKLATGKRVVEVVSEVLECFGGAGYVEDTGLPMLLRDAQVLPIWEGTTNVLSLDVLRVLDRHPESFATLLRRTATLANGARDAHLAAARQRLVDGLGALEAWIGDARGQDEGTLQGGARTLALALADAVSLALLLASAQHSLEGDGDPRPARAAQRFSRRAAFAVPDPDPQGDRALGTDIYV